MPKHFCLHDFYRRIDTQILIRYSLFTAVIVFMLVSPSYWFFENKNTLCIHKLVTGIQCPLCGMTRAAYLLLHFQIIPAIQYNIVILILPLYLATDLASVISGNTFWKQSKKYVIGALIASLLILYLVRLYLFFR